MSMMPRAGSCTPPFVTSESTFDYLRETRAYVARFGRPIAFYSDKHAIFRVNKREAAGGDGMTQFGRALHELNIDILCANSAPAKGRVERSFGTLQDRLVKEMRLAGISTTEAANAFLPGFIADYNERFGKAPLDLLDAHRPCTSWVSAGGCVCLEGGAHDHQQLVTAVRQGGLPAGEHRCDARPSPAARDGHRLSGWAARHPA
jgi:hypothetical protein